MSAEIREFLAAGYMDTREFVLGRAVEIPVHVIEATMTMADPWGPPAGFVTFENGLVYLTQGRIIMASTVEINFITWEGIEDS